LIPPSEGPARTRFTDTDTGHSSEYQLYNLETDLGQQQNLAAQEPERVASMKVAMEKITSKAK
jgi:hypothetical protein